MAAGVEGQALAGPADGGLRRRPRRRGPRLAVTRRHSHHVVLPGACGPAPSLDGRGTAPAGSRCPLDPLAPNGREGDQEEVDGRAAVTALCHSHPPGAGLVLLLRGHVRLLPQPHAQLRHGAHGHHGHRQLGFPARRHLLLVAHGGPGPDSALEDGLWGQVGQPGPGCPLRELPRYSHHVAGGPHRLDVHPVQHPGGWSAAVGRHGAGHLHRYGASGPAVGEGRRPGWAQSRRQGSSGADGPGPRTHIAGPRAHWFGHGWFGPGGPGPGRRDATGPLAPGREGQAPLSARELQLGGDVEGKGRFRTFASSSVSGGPGRGPSGG